MGTSDGDGVCRDMMIYLSDLCFLAPIIYINRYKQLNDNEEQCTMFVCVNYSLVGIILKWKLKND